MTKLNQAGSAAVVSLILSVLLLIGALAFGGWAFSSRQDYKNNVDSKIAAAVDVAKQQQGQVDQQKFDQQAKDPLTTYNGPEAYGSLVVRFPKTWSAYVDTTGNDGNPVDGYFAPGVVPATGGANSVFALRVQVLSQSYSQVVQSFTGQERTGKLTSTAYALPKLPNITGVKVVGQLQGQSANVTMVALPLRSATLEIWTQGSQYLGDFNTNILPNFSFSP